MTWTMTVTARWIAKIRTVQRITTARAPAAATASATRVKTATAVRMTATVIAGDDLLVAIAAVTGSSRGLKGMVAATVKFNMAGDVQPLQQARKTCNWIGAST